MHGDTRCGSQWDGFNTAHCAKCHKTFTVVSAFDKHQRITKGKVTCADPAEVGLVLSSRSYECWSFPGPEEKIVYKS